MKMAIKELFSDEHGRVSSKRVAGLVCVLALNIALIANTFSHESIKPADSLVDAVALFAFGALGLSTTEKIFGKKDKNAE
jgi:hypothetical protein